MSDYGHPEEGLTGSEWHCQPERPDEQHEKTWRTLIDIDLAEINERRECREVNRGQVMRNLCYSGKRSRSLLRFDSCFCSFFRQPGGRESSRTKPMTVILCGESDRPKAQHTQSRSLT